MYKFLAKFFRWLLKLNPKCYVCQERDSQELSFVSRHGIYGTELDPFYFHEGCIYAVLDDPEFYGHRIVDRALWIFDKKIQEGKEKKELLSQQKLRIEEIKNADFWGQLSR